MRYSQTSVPERLLALDIETIPDRTRLPPDWGAKFPKAIFHQVVAISFVEAEITADGDGGERYDVTACRSGGEAGWSEVQLLQSFWSYFARRPTRIVGWNTRSFDCSVLTQRSMAHGLTAHGWFGRGNRYDGYTYRYSDAWHSDLMDVISDYGACQKCRSTRPQAPAGCRAKSAVMAPRWMLWSRPVRSSRFAPIARPIRSTCSASTRVTACSPAG